MNEEPAVTFAGPSDLIAKLLMHRNASDERRQALFGNISDDGLRYLIRLAYFVSSTAAEGHYPRIRLFVPPEIGSLPILDDPWPLARFNEPVHLLEVEDLRRLIPSAASHDLALEIHERINANGACRLLCTGVCSAHSRRSASEVFSTSLWTSFTRPGLMIRIDGPGELRVSEGDNAWHLRGGTLFELAGSSVLLPLWIDTVAKQCINEARIQQRFKHAIHFAWHEILHLVSEQRCGGCLVVVPKVNLTAKQVEEDYGIRLKACTDGPRLGQEIAEFVQFCSTAEKSEESGEFKDLAGHWLSESHKLLSHIDSLAQIAAVDGCTVFNAELQLIGFGGRIEVLQATNAKQLVNASTGQVLDEDVMGATGTRHHSASRLCQAHGDMWCYVVSQDGQITAFWSDDQFVNRWVPYWPWANTSNRF